MICLSIIRSRKRALVCPENPFSREIWPEHLLKETRNKSASANFFIFGSFLVGTSNATRYAKFLIVELGRSIKRQPIKIKENVDTLLEIDAL